MLDLFIEMLDAFANEMLDFTDVIVNDPVRGPIIIILLILLLLQMMIMMCFLSGGK